MRWGFAESQQQQDNLMCCCRMLSKIPCSNADKETKTQIVDKDRST